MNHFWDARHGGAFWRLDDAGKVMDDSKKTYGQAFYIYALTEFYRAFGNPLALDRMPTNSNSRAQPRGGMPRCASRFHCGSRLCGSAV